METKFANVMEIAKILNESPFTIRDWKNRGKIPFFKRGRRLQFDVEEIMKWDQECNYHPARNWKKTGKQGNS